MCAYHIFVHFFFDWLIECSGMCVCVCVCECVCVYPLIDTQCTHTAHTRTHAICSVWSLVECVMITHLGCEVCDHCRPRGMCDIWMTFKEKETCYLGPSLWWWKWEINIATSHSVTTHSMHSTAFGPEQYITRINPPGTGEGGDWWSWPMGVKAEGTPRVCQGE